MEHLFRKYLKQTIYTCTYRPTVYAISVGSIISGDTPVLQGFVGPGLDRLP